MQADDAEPVFTTGKKYPYNIHTDMTSIQNNERAGGIP